MQHQLIASFFRTFAVAPSHLSQAPGRVNLIGEHTDYNDGFVLPCAIDFHTQVALRARQDKTVRVLACNAGLAVDTFHLDQPIVPCVDLPWANYIRGLFAILLSAGYRFAGVDIALIGDVPQGAGLSSSASLEVAVLAGLNDVLSLNLSLENLAQLARKAENEFVGTQCGIMDMWISATAKAGCASLLDCRSLDSVPCHMPAQLQLVIINSKVKRGLLDSAYNQRRLQCETAAAHFAVPALRDLGLEQLEAARTQMDSVVFRRARHVISENARTLQMAKALEQASIAEISHIMAASHASMRDDFEITVPSIDRIVQTIDSVLGSQGGVRMTGGGFGGCIISLMPQHLVASCQQALADSYRSPDGAAAEVYLPAISAGASSHSLQLPQIIKPGFAADVPPPARG